MKKNIDLIVNGVKPEKVMYDTDNHSLVVFYPPQREFKRGDILTSGNILLIFDKYETFNQENDSFYSIWNSVRMSNKNWQTKYFVHATEEQKAQVHELLRKEGKKWNAETLQIEDIKEEFKRGDIVFEDGRIIIVKNMPSNYYVLYYQHRNNISFNSLYGTPFSASTVRLATPEEQQTLFDALKKEGLKWNAEKLEIEKLDIGEIVYNLSSACSYLNKPVPDFKSLLLTISNEDFHKYKAQITLQLIREAWNKFDGFEANWNWNDNEQNIKYCPIIDDDEIAFSCHNVVKTIESTCYSFPTKERALQFCNQFKELFETAMGL